MLTAQERIYKLQYARALLLDADAMIQTALGPTDECYEYHNALGSLIDELAEEIEQLGPKDTDPGYLDSPAHLENLE